MCQYTTRVLTDSQSSANGPQQLSTIFVSLSGGRTSAKAPGPITFIVLAWKGPVLPITRAAGCKAPCTSNTVGWPTHLG